MYRPLNTINNPQTLEARDVPAIFGSEHAFDHILVDAS